MSEETWECYGALKVIRQQEKAQRRETVPVSLEQRGIKFESKNNGAHLIIEGRYDFWPGTGLWKDRKNVKQGRGFKSLMRELAK